MPEQPPRLLFDENLAARLVGTLADLYPSSVHVSEVGLAPAPDRAIWAHARDHGLVIVTREVREFVDEGGVISYGPSLRDMIRRAPSFLDKILKGARPGDLPVELPTQFELVINVESATALGLTVPQTLLLRADGVIK